MMAYATSSFWMKKIGFAVLVLLAIVVLLGVYHDYQVLSTSLKSTLVLVDKDPSLGMQSSSLPSRLPSASPSDIPSMDNIYIAAFPNSTTMNEIKTSEDLKKLINLDIPVPSNLNIAFMGDSLTRYQYLDLVYFLSHNGTWVQPDAIPNMVIEKTHNSWKGFYNYTKTTLQPYEECDCFRTLKWNLKDKGKNTIENRYFHDAERNNTVSFLQKFGDLEFRTSWNVSTIHESHELIQDISGFKFIYEAAWVGAIQNFVCKMIPKPSVFIFNAGIWPNDDLVDVALQGEIVGALKDCGIISVFKTTTKAKGDTADDRFLADYEQQLCNQTDMCLDVSWTSIVSNEHYWDNFHFLPPIYSYLNVNLLSLLSSSNNRG